MTEKPKLLFDSVVSITPVGRRLCYDFEISNYHNFFANGILVHNSGALEEVADCVLLCEQRSLSEGKLSLDEQLLPTEFAVTVAKHRRGPMSEFTLMFNKPCHEFEEPEGGWQPKRPEESVVVKP